MYSPAILSLSSPPICTLSPPAICSAFTRVHAPQVAQELLSTERAYVDSLGSVRALLLEPLVGKLRRNEPVLVQHEIDQVWMQWNVVVCMIVCMILCMIVCMIVCMYDCCLYVVCMIVCMIVVCMFDCCLYV